MPLFNGQERYTPLSDWLEGLIRTVLTPNSTSLGSNDPFTDLFDEFEVIGAMAYRALIRERRKHLWVPAGCWAWRRTWNDEIPNRLLADLDSRNANSKLIRLGLFKNGKEEAKEIAAEVAQFRGELNFR